MGKLVTVALLAVLCSGCLVGDVWGMGMKAGGLELNLDELKAGVLQEFRSGKSMGCFALPALERVVAEIPLTLSIAGIQTEGGTFSPSGLRLGGIVSVDGRALAEKMGMVYKLPENIDLGLCYSFANSEHLFGLFVALKL